MFKVNNKDTKTMLWCRFGGFIVNFEHVSHLCSSVSVVNFEHVIVSWAIPEYRSNNTTENQKVKRPVLMFIVSIVSQNSRD